jgi:hypothetical protein
MDSAGTYSEKSYLVKISNFIKSFKTSEIVLFLLRLTIYKRISRVKIQNGFVLKRKILFQTRITFYLLRYFFLYETR